MWLCQPFYQLNTYWNVQVHLVLGCFGFTPKFVVTRITKTPTLRTTKVPVTYLAVPTKIDGAIRNFCKHSPVGIAGECTFCIARKLCQGVNLKFYTSQFVHTRLSGWSFELSRRGHKPRVAGSNLGQCSGSERSYRQSRCDKLNTSSLYEQFVRYNAYQFKLWCNL